MAKNKFVLAAVLAALGWAALVGASGSPTAMPSSFDLKDVTVTLNQAFAHGWGERLDISVEGSGNLFVERRRFDPRTKREDLLSSCNLAVERGQVVGLLEVIYAADFGALPEKIDQRPVLRAAPGGGVTVSAAQGSGDQAWSAITVRIGPYQKVVADRTDRHPQFQAVERAILQLAKERSIR